MGAEAGPLTAAPVSGRTRTGAAACVCTAAGAPASASTAGAATSVRAATGAAASVSTGAGSAVVLRARPPTPEVSATPPTSRAAAHHRSGLTPSPSTSAADDIPKTGTSRVKGATDEAG
ncbi:hypothetical protein ADK33_29325 [Streptomyces griseus subsp. rhodochrous]|nr:hypothetical protein ADK33_29325 [Streptomyces griseus subsp. rhodochrous]